MRRPPTLWLGFALLAATFLGTGPAAADDGIPRYLLVWQDATLYTDASADAPGVRIFTWSAEQRADHPGELMWVEFVAEHGEYCEVLTRQTIYADGQCYGTVPDLWNYEVHLFVRREDVAQATTREVGVSFDDGSGVSLQPGVALMALPGKKRTTRYRASVAGLSVDVELPADAVGTLFRPNAHGFEGGWLDERLKDDVPMWLGDGSAVLRYDPWSPRRLAVRDDHARGALVTLRTSCAEFRVAVSEGDLVDGAESGALAGLLGTMGSGTTCPALVQVAPPDTPVYFPDGRSAGQIVHEREFQKGDLETTSGADRELQCDCVLLGGGHEHLASIQERTLKLCFRPENLVSEERNVAFGSFEDLFEGIDPGDIDGAFENISGVEVAGEDE